MKQSINDKFIRNCKRGKIDEVLNDLKNPEVDPTFFNSYSLQIAAAHGHNEIVLALLLDDRINPIALDNCAIKVAWPYNKRGFVTGLLNRSETTPKKFRLETRCKSKDVKTFHRAYKLLRLHPKVIVRSYKLGQDYHTEKELDELEISHPELFI